MMNRNLPKRRLLQALHRDGGGAALVEFAMAITPILILFFGMIQWSINAYVNLIVQHAASVAARTLAVELPGMPDNGGASGSTTDLVKAITPLFVHVPNVLSVGGISNISVSIPTKANNNCDQTINTVKVSVLYPCFVPLGNAVACGGGLSGIVGGATGYYYQQLTATASFPNQGSYYQKVWQSKIGGNGCNAGGS
jgi:hypothetical protein